jgi:hypothetical protein
VSQYDNYLRGYQTAAISVERLSATLNAGQAIILSLGERRSSAAAAASATGAALACRCDWLSRCRLAGYVARRPGPQRQR